MSDQPLPFLSVDGCQRRQARLRERLEALRLDAALFLDRGYVHYFTGCWVRPPFAAALLVKRDGPTALATPFPPERQPACDDLLAYESNRLATLVPDQEAAALRGIASRLAGVSRLGIDAVVPRRFVFAGTCVELQDAMRDLRRGKDPDEVEMIRHAIRATEAAYRHAFDTLAEGVTETDLYAGMLGAAAKALGEPIGDFGNDFQIGSGGGLPRPRPAQRGEIAVLDLSVMVRSYRSDLCRSFVVGRRPTDQQLEAHRRVLAALAHVEAAARPGASCRHIDAEVRTLLANDRGWSFPHHLGHGLGLDAHEAPRLNPNWDEHFAVGDVFTVEPGLYHPELRGGLRIEHNFWLGETGLVRLDGFPVEMA
jgi:Xaa-Pro aminopeptidase